MSNSMDKLAKGIRSAIKEKDDRVPKPFDTSATVLSKEGDTLWVHIPGGVDRTPVKRTIDAEEGDQIMVRVSDGRAWAVGNSTNPPTDGRVAEIAYKQSVSAGTKVNNLNEFVMENSRIVNADIENVKLKNVEMENVMAQNARITNSFIDGLTAVGSDIRNSKIEGFTVIEGVVRGLQADRTETQELIAEKATITDLNAATARIDDLEADHVTVAELNAAKGRITTLESTKIDAQVVEANYAHIDLANVNNAWIQSGVIKDGAISNAQILDVSANKLTAGTIDASNITVTNLNASNITTGTINGQRIGTGSLSLDKLAEEVPTKEYLDNVAENLQGQIDGQIETWTGTVVPTLQNSPAVNWTNASEKHKHVGDIYYVVNTANDADGYTYRFTESGSGASATYSWTLIKDNQITKALQDILDMQGDISGIKTFDSQISSWKTSTDEELSSLKSRTSTLETDMGTKVSTTTFNQLSQTVGENSASITSLNNIVNVVYVPTTDTAIDPNKTYYIYSQGQYVAVENPVASDLENYFEKSTTQEVSNTVNVVKQTADTNSSTITRLISDVVTVENNAKEYTNIAVQSSESRLQTQIDQTNSNILLRSIEQTIINNYIYVPTTDIDIDPTKVYYVKENGNWTVVADPVVGDLASYYERGTEYRYELTSDATIDPNKTYYVKDGNVWTVVTNPVVEDIETYYERYTVDVQTDPASAVASMLVESYINITPDEIKISADKVSFEGSNSFNSAVQDIVDTSTDEIQDSLNAKIDRVNGDSSMTWSNGTLAIEAKSSSGNYATVIGGDGIEFVSGYETLDDPSYKDNVVASINQDKLNISKTVVLDRMEVGPSKWAWVYDKSDESIFLKWIG